MSNRRAYDFFGNLVVAKFPRGTKEKDKKKFAIQLMKEQKSIKTVLEKIGKVKGRLRKIQTKYLAGERTKEVLYRENNCVFRFNLDTCYFSPRLSNERKEIASKIPKDAKVLVIFAGVAPYSVVIAKNSKAKEVTSIEINREASKYAQLNVELNNLKNKVRVIQGDIKKVAPKLAKKNEKFDVIIMARPQLKDSFLKEAFMLSKKASKGKDKKGKKTGTKIYYYDFCGVDEINKIIEKIKLEAKKAKKKIKILGSKAAGETAPYKIRLRVDFLVALF